MVFCAAESHQPFTREAEIAFPHNVELKCNSDEVKANLRGLKNRPGSTRPADITHLVRKKANYPNSVEIVYALTIKVRPQIDPLHQFPLFCPISKSRNYHAKQDKCKQQKFYLVVNLVKQKSIDTMVSEIRQGRIISKEQTLRESEFARHHIVLGAYNEQCEPRPKTRMRLSLLQPFSH